jgi:HK97 gp10 family phage protein
LNEIRIEGIEELNRKFQVIVKATDKAAKESLLSSANFVADRIRDKAPQGPTGNLKKSVRAKMLSEKSGYPFVAIAGVDRKIGRHAWLVEYGGSNVRFPGGSPWYFGKKKSAAMALNTPWGPRAYVGPMTPHPYFRPAIMETMPQVYSRLQKDIKREIEESV